MGRDRTFQPTTKSTGDLAIGLMKVSVGDAQDVGSAALAVGGVTTLGALKASSVSMKPTFKEHKAGYPQITDFKVAEVLQATVKADVEEIFLPKNLELLDEAIDTLETGTPHFHCVESLSEYATGGVLSLFSPYAQLKPNLNLSFGDDFSSIPFEFETLSNSAFTNKNLLYRKRVAAATRDIANQPMTVDTENLGIGMFQVRVGKPSKRAAGVATNGPAQLRKKGTGVVSYPTMTVSGAYTGAIDGAIILKCIDSANGAIVFQVILPDGSTGANITLAVADTAVAIGTTGLSIKSSAVLAAAFSETGNSDAAAPTHGDVYVIGVTTSAARASNETGILSPYSFLTAADRIGAVASSSMATSATFKEHFSGYPKVRDLLVLESSTMDITAGLQEISAATTSLVTGEAGTLFDMLFDSSINGQLYYVPVEVVSNLATGGTLSFWFPNCQVVPEADFAPGNDWAQMTFKLSAAVQAGVKRIYRQTNVPG